MSKKTKSILLVGGTGYLGQHLELFLKNDYKIFITGTSIDDLRNNYITIDFKIPSTYSNLLDYSFDLIIFLAASIRGLNTTNLIHKDMETNVHDFSRFLQYILEKNSPKKVIYISSMTVYSQFSVSPVSESAKTLPIHIYGLSKLMAEQLVFFLCNRHDISGLILRLPGIFGGNKKSGYIYNIAKKLKNNANIDIDTTGLGFWETIEVNDLCQQITRIIKTSCWRKSCDIINISYGHAIDFIETAFKIKEMLNSTSHISIINPLGYTPFYMDNRKLKCLIHSEISFEKSLLKYVTSI